MASGLGNIFSSQLELGEMAIEQGLLKDVEIKSLQAQVNPHFLFNAINTISALIRIDSEKARYLLLQLSHYFRSNLTSTRQKTITVEEEVSHLKAYLTIEQARFPNRYQVDLDIPEKLQGAYLPPFVMQVLVENALKHAFISRKTDNKVIVKMLSEHNQLKLQVMDNGNGISKDILPKLGKEVITSSKGTGSALENLNRRLVSLYGDKAGFNVSSSEKGTQFEILMPLQMKEQVE